MAKGSGVDFDQAKQVTVIIAVAVGLLNLAFYFLSTMYFEDRAATYGMASDATIRSARTAFAVMTGCVGLTAIIAQFATRYVAHGLAILVGILAIVGAVAAGMKDFHPVLPVALGLIGFLLLALATFSFLWRSRAAWAFLISTCGVGALVTLFGATKVRNAVDVSLYHALIVPGILVVATVMLIALSDEYAEKT